MDGKTVEEQRRALGWSRAELARRAGLDPHTVSVVEGATQGRKPRQQTLDRIARAFRDASASTQTK